jgi:hypothetical protein
MADQPGLIPNKPIDAAVITSAHIVELSAGAATHVRWELGIPSDLRLFQVTFGPPLSWKAPVFDLIGTFPAPDATRERFWLQLMEFWDQFNIPGIVQWQRRVYLAEPAGVSVAVRWHPHREEDTILVMPSTLDPTDAARYLRDGLRLLRDLDRRGRRRNSGYYPTQRAFHDAWHRYKQEIQRRHQEDSRTHWERVIDAELWKALGLSKSQFYTYLQRHGRPTDP